MTVHNSSITGIVINRLESVILSYTFSFYEEGIVRFTLFEEDGLYIRLPISDVLIDYVEPCPISATKDNETMTIKFGNYQMKIYFKRFLFELSDENGVYMMLNKNKMFNFEHYRERPRWMPEVTVKSSSIKGKESTVTVPSTTAVRRKPLSLPIPGKYPAETDNMWEETWRGFTDSKPRGPSSLGLEVTFVGMSDVHGLPERATTLSLPTTKGRDPVIREPIRLYNTDVFQYEMDSLQPLYGSIPLVVGRHPMTGRAAGCLWLNAADTWVDIEKERGTDTFSTSVIDAETGEMYTKNGRPAIKTNITVHFISEAGRMDVLCWPGNNRKSKNQSKMKSTEEMKQQQQKNESIKENESASNKTSVNTTANNTSTSNSSSANSQPFHDRGHYLTGIASVMWKYARLTGAPCLPPLFALGYHQCRWNYFTDAEVSGIVAGFDEHRIPMDVVWLDVEHTERKKYFTWNRLSFPEPVVMQEKMAQMGLKLVTIVDPHVKQEGGYPVGGEAGVNGFLIRTSDGETPFEGNCWPGISVYPDFLDPTTRYWWSEYFSAAPRRFGESSEILQATGQAWSASTLGTPILHHWNDMNEPTVFDGPETSMPKDCLHLDGREHREVHNVFGHHFVMATHQGMSTRYAFTSKTQYQSSSAAASATARKHSQPLPMQAERPFILTRSFFAGTQRYAAMWTGDNTASWSQLRGGIAMLLTISVSGFPFVGTDIGGFFFDPTPELMIRWYQAAAFTPFFRSHAHLDTKHREPWMFEATDKDIMREAIIGRYKLLPLFYTLFHEAADVGLPVMRPVWMECAWELPRTTDTSEIAGFKQHTTENVEESKKQNEGNTEDNDEQQEASTNSSNESDENKKTEQTNSTKPNEKLLEERKKAAKLRKEEKKREKLRTEHFYADEETFMVGSSLYVVPITESGIKTKTIYLPPYRNPDALSRDTKEADELSEPSFSPNITQPPVDRSGCLLWYSHATGRSYNACRSHPIQMAVRRSHIPVFQRGGSVVPTWQRYRRSSFHMINDPLTLIVAPDGNGQAEGELFMDDGHSHAWAALGHMARRRFRMRKHVFDVLDEAEKVANNTSTSTTTGSNEAQKKTSLLGKLFGKGAGKAEVGSKKPSKPTATLTITNRDIPQPPVGFRHITSTDYYAGLISSMRQAAAQVSALSSNRTSSPSSSNSNSSSNSSTNTSAYDAAVDAAIESVFEPLVFPPFIDSDSPPLQSTWAEIKERSWVEKIILRGQPTEPFKAVLRIKKQKEQGKNEEKLVEEIPIAFEYTPHSNTATLVIPKQARTCEDWDIVITI
ncbi:putative alpha glucosidase II [Monocercomonoides exilis]|uniref:putative alpha glucosidase II n=1 Tax=Monocercomonoides exilis TaxID=2049356 RepID=UPI00355AB7DD|nr:putative alpha glucosidase II [Monocercomonoides exilis]|eukprot:MONOS_10653.1-p1 / transcript=MONOS_10653.1 / gene=MONOS_10653 / organism=Monocercomonoides_exilis_PA203 / gene_product=alpha glucosidase II / transcript_product=alpha glucosidase II / location=Mono_scaffold00492:34432-38322(-) / protein_length=1296 / sequence_SO=supercontig / SO=protein_coding / is_pseudo=false